MKPARYENVSSSWTSLIVKHVNIKHQAIKTQQQELIQWAVPPKTKNTQNGNDLFGSNKQIILKRKITTETTKQIRSVGGSSNP
jgi:hypothetical protein